MLINMSKVKDNTTNPGKAFYDKHYRTCVGVVVKVETKTELYVAEVIEVKATRGCLGKVTFVLKQLSGKVTEISWRDEEFVSISLMGIEDLQRYFK